MSSPEEQQKPYLPTSQEFYLNYALYDCVDLSSISSVKFHALITAPGTFDSYCPECKGHSVFTRSSNSSGYTLFTDHITFGYSNQIFVCARNNKHFLRFILRASQEDLTLQKVGQFPSVADLNMHDVKKYSLVLSKQYFSELKKAIGLAAHGVGVGSFVYLRRIFESLIEEAKNEAAKDESFDLVMFNNARMSDRIKILSNYLPSFLVENSSIYGILSKGVHELTEQDCLSAFPVVKVGIELILDEHIVEKQRKDKIEASRKALAQLVNKK